MIQSVIDILVNSATVASLIGVSTQNEVKIYPVRAPQKEKRPYVIIRRSANLPVQFKSAPSDMDKVTFSVVVYAESYKKASDISDAIRVAIDGYVGGDIRNLIYQTSEDLFDPEDGNDGSVVIADQYTGMTIRSTT